MRTVAVLGTGIMGTGLAHSLIRAGHQVRVWNRSPERAAPLAADGAVVAGSLDEAVAGADAVILILFDTRAVVEVITAAAPTIGPDCLILQASTVGPEGVAAAAAVAARYGLAFLDAPVIGTRGPAELGQLVILASGDPGLAQRAQPIFEAIGARTMWIGDRIGQASALKLAVNCWVGAINIGAAQALSLTRRAGLDPQLFLDTIAGGATDTAYAHLKGAQMIADEFPVSFTVDGVAKDLELIGAMADDVGVPTTVIDAFAAMYRTAAERGRGDQDMAAVVHAFEPPSG